MEQGLRDCCRSIRIGKILIQSEEDTHEAKVVYAKVPPDIENRKVLLMYPIMSEYWNSFNTLTGLKRHNIFVEPACGELDIAVTLEEGCKCMCILLHLFLSFFLLSYAYIWSQWGNGVSCTTPRSLSLRSRSHKVQYNYGESCLIYDFVKQEGICK